MFRPRIIPVLLLKGKGLVKTVRFKNPQYIGDPINAVRIFNDLCADELVFLDITASIENRSISKELVKEIGDEAYMPFTVGGGITSLEQIKDLLNLGAEKIVLNTVLANDPSLIEKTAKTFGSQSIIASVDVKKDFFGKYIVKTESGNKKTTHVLLEYVKSLENAGAGEVMINSIDLDGTYSGYDISLIKRVSEILSIPVIACGGAGTVLDFKLACIEGGASACAAGSMFVYHGARRGVLINYPDKTEIKNMFNQNV